MGTDNLLTQVTADLTLGQLLGSYNPETAPQIIKAISDWKIEDLKHAENVDGLIPVVPCVDTMRVLHRSGEELQSVPGVSADRSVLYGVQTPQVFKSEILKAAYAQAYDTAFTDDASVVEKYGKNLSFVIGERFNIKLTTPDDLKIARALIEG
jgi:2-C-methyl-D-erythritol 4-phosphate cytidylyltransferase